VASPGAEYSIVWESPPPIKHPPASQDNPKTEILAWPFWSKIVAPCFTTGVELSTVNDDSAALTDPWSVARVPKASEKRIFVFVIPLEKGCREKL